MNRNYVAVVAALILLLVIGIGWLILGGMANESSLGLSTQIQNHVQNLENILILRDTYTNEIMAAGLGISTGLIIGAIASFGTFKRKL